VDLGQGCRKARPPRSLARAIAGCGRRGARAAPSRDAGAFDLGHRRRETPRLWLSSSTGLHHTA